MLRPCICVPWSVVPSLQWLFVYYIFAVFPWAGSAARIARLGRVKRGSQHRDPGAGTGGEQWAGWSHYQHLHIAPAAHRVPIIGPHGHHTAPGHGDNCVSSNGSPSAQVNCEGIETGDKIDTKENRRRMLQFSPGPQLNSSTSVHLSFVVFALKPFVVFIINFLPIFPSQNWCACLDTVSAAKYPHILP